jgi:hypothetical protein
MRMVPISTGLVRGRELIQERVSWADGTLIDSSDAVFVVGGVLKHAVPVLRRGKLDKPDAQVEAGRTMLVPRYWVGSVMLLTRLICKRSP